MRIFLKNKQLNYQSRQTCSMFTILQFAYKVAIYSKTPSKNLNLKKKKLCIQKIMQNKKMNMAIVINCERVEFERIESQIDFRSVLR